MKTRYFSSIVLLGCTCWMNLVWAQSSWTQRLTGKYSDQAKSIEKTADGGYIIAGTKGQAGDNKQSAWLLKLDSSGNVQWNQTFGTEEEVGQSAKQTPDGGYALLSPTNKANSGDEDFWACQNRCERRKAVGEDIRCKR